MDPRVAEFLSPPRSGSGSQQGTAAEPPLGGAVPASPCPSSPALHAMDEVLSKMSNDMEELQRMLVAERERRFLAEEASRFLWTKLKEVTGRVDAQAERLSAMAGELSALKAREEEREREVTSLRTLTGTAAQATVALLTAQPPMATREGRGEGEAKATAVPGGSGGAETEAGRIPTSRVEAGHASQLERAEEEDENARFSRHRDQGLASGDDDEQYSEY